MSKTNHSALSLGKFGDLVFTRQTPFAGVETHRSVFSNLVTRYHAWRAQRAAAAELAGLSDRELSDIGVSRQQISNVVRAKIK